MSAKSEHFHLNPFSLVTLCAGILAFAYAFAAHKFLTIFVSAGAVWLVVIMALQERWRPGDATVPGKKRMFRGIATALGFLIFVSAWYLIVALDPSLR
jgi:hypothetical protein